MLKGAFMFIRNLYLLPITIIFALTVMSCSAVPLAKPEQDAMAKSFSVEADKSNIYIYRNETENFNSEMAVDIDGKHVGATSQRTFIVSSVQPGKHTIAAHGENVSRIEITTEAGKNYFVWLEVTVGAFIPRAKLHSVDQETGEAGVKKCNLIK